MKVLSLVQHRKDYILRTEHSFSSLHWKNLALFHGQHQILTAHSGRTLGNHVAIRRKNIRGEFPLTFAVLKFLLLSLKRVQYFELMYYSKPEDSIKNESLLLGNRGIANTILAVVFFDGHSKRPNFFIQISLSFFRDFESSLGFQQGSRISLSLNAV